MGLALTTRWQVTGDVDAFETRADTHRDLRPVLVALGVYLMGAAQDRLVRGLAMSEGGVRSGRLTASLHVGAAGQAGSGDSMFELSAGSVEVGTNVPYAAQRQFGGTIRPKPPLKCLAVPLVDALKRDALWPRDLDPNHEILVRLPSRSGGGVLIDPENELGYGTGPLFFLAREVHQEGLEFVGISEADAEEIDSIYHEMVAG